MPSCSGKTGSSCQSINHRFDVEFLEIFRKELKRYIYTTDFVKHFAVKSGFSWLLNEVGGLSQCDQIGQFIGLWAIFQSLWQQLIYPNLPHS